MTQISLTDPAAQTSTPVNPSDLLMHLIVALLAPMFLSASAGDIGFARLAAIETVNAYRIRNHADLLTVAQIIAFGLTALGSLSLSLADGVSLPMALRLRGNANALNRSGQQNRRALRESGVHAAAPDEAAPPASGVHYTDEAAMVEAATSADQLQPAEELCVPATAPTPAQLTCPTPVAQRQQVIWAEAMVTEAAKLTAGLANLPPAERKLAEHRAAALTSTAAALLSGSAALPPAPIATAQTNLA
jgi:hypothetical protein